MFVHTVPVLTGQRTFDELGTPLADVTFVVVDLETTGGDPNTCGITEVGAVKLRGGETVGTFHTMVDPGRAIPPSITVLTGITQAMVVRAPRIEAVLPSLLEFMDGAVVVGHNVRFDVAFLDAALLRNDRSRLPHRRVDTVRLARRLLADEVRNHRLGTLAAQLRLPHQPSHRALDDALATGDLLHVLLERAAALGVTGLDDLISLPMLANHPQAEKLRLTEDLPRARGVYLFRGRDGQVLYVGKATDLRSRVRSYFSGDERRKVAQLLREVHRIDHRVCPAPLEADILELRLIHRHQPRFNRQGTRHAGAAYVKLTRRERFPRLSVVSTPKDDGALYLGPMGSRRAAKLVAEAIESVVPLRRCTGRPPSRPRSSPCLPAQLGKAVCPCAGDVAPADYARHVQQVVRGLTVDAQALLGPLEQQMASYAGAERFEEAADVRDRAAALADALRRQRRMEALRAWGTARVRLEGHGGARLERGRVVEAWTDDDAALPPRLPLDGVPSTEPEAGPDPLFVVPDLGPPLTPEEAEELLCVAGWLDRHATTIDVDAEHPRAWPPPPLPSFHPTPAPKERVLRR